MMRKTVYFFLTVLALLSCLVACNFSINDLPPDEDKEDELDLGIWHFGYVGSDSDPDFPQKICDGDEEYLYSDVIELGKAGTKITFTVENPTFDKKEVLTLSFWEKTDDGFVLWEQAPNVKSSDNSVIKQEEIGIAYYTYVSSTDGECIRFSYRHGSDFSGILPTVTVEECDEVGTFYDKFERLEYLKMERERAYFDILEGKRAYFIGDSLFGAHGIGKENSWINLLCEKYKMDFENAGINGCTVSDCENGSNPIVKRYVDLPEEQPDFIVIEGGRNDFNKMAKIGSVDEKDPTTYLGAIAITVEGLRAKYPNAKIIAVTFWKTGTVNKEEVASNTYVEAMIDACEKLSIPCIKAYNEEESGIYMTDKEFRTQYCFVPGDVCHLNVEGMKLALPYFEKEIARILAE